MKPVELWVQALRSGEYKQTTGHLQDRKGFCCLGVACEVYRKHVDPDFPASQSTSASEFWMYGDDGEASYCPEEVKNWLGLSTQLGRYLANDCEGSLAGDNDAGCDFESIACTIEARPTGLFED